MATVSTSKQAIRQSARVVNEICTYRWFLPDVIAAMLVHRTKEKKVFWEFDSIIMQNGHNLLRRRGLVSPSLMKLVYKHAKICLVTRYMMMPFTKTQLT